MEAEISTFASFKARIVNPAPMQIKPVASAASPRCSKRARRSWDGELQGLPKEPARGRENEGFVTTTFRVFFASPFVPEVFIATAWANSASPRRSKWAPRRRSEARGRRWLRPSDAVRQREADVGVEPEPAVKDGGARHAVALHDPSDGPGEPHHDHHRGDARRQEDPGFAQGHVLRASPEQKSCAGRST